MPPAHDHAFFRDDASLIISYMTFAALPRGVLLLAYSYPPRGGVGSQRALRLAKGLKERGWRVSILTAAAGPSVLPTSPSEGQLPGLEVLEAPYRDRTAFFSRVLRLARSRGVGVDPEHQSLPPPARRSSIWLALRALLLFPDEHVGWIRGATASGLDRLRRGDLGAIISTSPPESAHIIAARIHRRTRLPWIADFRDPWSFSHFRAPGPMDLAHRLTEARTVRQAAALVTVTQSWAERFRRAYPTHRIEVIPNGFDHATFGTPVLRDRRVFCLTYTGKLDLEQQSPAVLFRSVRAAFDADEIDPLRLRLIFHCYGTPEAPIRQLATRVGIESSLQWAGPLSSAQSHVAQQAAAALIVFGWASDPGCVPAKLFDYLGSERRILFFGSRDSEAASILRLTGRGAAVDSVDSCREALVEWYREWCGEGRLPAGGGTGAADRYAFHHRVEEYDRLLGELTGSPR